ncbi:hypothetical protein ACLB2K_004501 [Fragaria x ananassa]
MLSDQTYYGILVGAGDAPSSSETPPVPLMTVEDFRREFNSDPGDDTEIELIIRVMQPLIPEYGFRNAFFIVLARTGSLDGVQKILNISPDVIKARSLSTGQTALHGAVYGGQVQVVKMLVEFMSAEDLELLGNGKTALISASEMGFVQMAKCMVEKNERLVTIRCATTNMLPIYFAVYAEKWEMVRYLYPLTPIEALTQEDNGRSGAQIMSSCFYSHQLGIQIQPSASDGSDISTNAVNTEDGQGTKRNIIIHSGVNHIRQKKLVHIRTLEILQFMAQATRDLTLEKMQGGVVQKAILQAIERGNVEFVRMMSDANFLIYMLSDGKGKQLLHYSIECRQEEIYCLLSGSIPSRPGPEILRPESNF